MSKAKWQPTSYADGIVLCCGLVAPPSTHLSMKSVGLQHQGWQLPPSCSCKHFGSLMSLKRKGLVIIPKSVAAKPEHNGDLYRRCLRKMETPGSGVDEFEFDDRSCQIWQSNWQPLV